MNKKLLCRFMLGYIFMVPLSAQAQLPPEALTEMCQMDIELTEYLGAVLHGEEPSVDPLSEEHKGEVQKIIEENQGLDIPQLYQKVIGECSDGSIFKGRY